MPPKTDPSRPTPGAALRADWQPIDTAPNDEPVLFWVIAKPPEECYIDSAGHPIFTGGPPRIHMGKYGTWSSLSKATHWMPLPSDPPAALPPEAKLRQVLTITGRDEAEAQLAAQDAVIGALIDTWRWRHDVSKDRYDCAEDLSAAVAAVRAARPKE